VSIRKSEADEATQALRAKYEAAVAEKNLLAKKLKTLEPKSEKLAKAKTKLRSFKEQMATVRRESGEIQRSNEELEVYDY
jgi:hypothetical protein